VVADFYADWCGPCKQIAPMYEQLSQQLTRPNKISFTKIDVDQQAELASAYGVTAMPTFMVFKNARAIQTIRGADPRKLSEVVKKLANEANAVGDGSAAGGFGEGSGNGSMWLGAPLPKGFSDVTDQVDMQNLELLNIDSGFGGARALFAGGKPDGEWLTIPRSRSITDSKAEKAAKSTWVESDTDEQLMLYMPFQSTLKIHSLHLTSLPPTSDDSEAPSRPAKIKIYTNRAHILGFDDAEDAVATQEVTLSKSDWDSKTGTAKIELRFVKFQNVSSLVIFVVENEVEDSEKTRLDRIRVIGETGEKRDPGKLEKVGDEE
jgi:thioredoxin